MRQRSPILDDGTRKVCSQCERPLPYSAFGKKGRGGLRPECRECHGKYWVPYKEKVQPLQRTNHLKRTYNGFSDADYQALFERQQGLCAACGNAQTVMHYRKPLPLAVDHDHVTGKVRGLLCLACNRALGYLGDDPERIEALLRYAKSI